MIVSPDSIVGISPTSGERSRGRRQCSGFLHRHSSPRYPGPCLGDCPSWRSPQRISGSNYSTSPDRAWSSYYGGCFPDWWWPWGARRPARRIHHGSGGHSGHHIRSRCSDQGLWLVCTLGNLMHKRLLFFSWICFNAMPSRMTVNVSCSFCFLLYRQYISYRLLLSLKIFTFWTRGDAGYWSRERIGYQIQMLW